MAEAWPKLCMRVAGAYRLSVNDSPP